MKNRSALLLLAGFLLAACQSGTGGSAPSVKESCWWGHTCFITEKRGGGQAVDLTLNYLGSYEPFTVRIKVTQSGMAGAYEPVSQLVLQGAQRIPIFSLQAGATSGFQWNWQFNQHPGSTPATHDETALYRLPFPDGQSYELLQGYGGTHSHGGDNYYSVDFDMPVGSPIVAARGGIVVSARSDSSSKGRGQDNHVMIRHSDGTYGWYLHLRKDGVTVELGQTVAAGDLIGYSGDTGYSSQPHLHFQVSSLSDDPDAFYRSFPTRFQTEDGITDTLWEGRRYTAVPLPAGH